MKENLLISACLLGESCRYDGRSVPAVCVEKLCEKYNLIKVCPEVDGGLPTPRTPSERVGDRVLMRDGKDVTENYQRGAVHALDMCKKHGCRIALLKEKSPSCGKGRIYDGTFSRTLTERDGVTAELLLANGIFVLGESEIDKILDK